VTASWPSWLLYCALVLHNQLPRRRIPAHTAPTQQTAPPQRRTATANSTTTTAHKKEKRTTAGLSPHERGTAESRQNQASAPGAATPTHRSGHGGQAVIDDDDGEVQRDRDRDGDRGRRRVRGRNTAATVCRRTRKAGRRRRT